MSVADAEPSIARSEATLTRQAVLAALEDASASLHRTTNLLARIESKPEGLTERANGVFTSFAEYSAQQQRWIGLALAGAQRRVQWASEVEDPDMQVALLRLAGPRLEAALCGTQLLAAWADFLQLADFVLRYCPYYGVERLFRDTARVHAKVEPAMTALTSLDPDQLEATASALPGLMKDLVHELESTRDALQLAAKREEQALLLKQFVETLTLASAMKMALPRLPPAAPITFGVGMAAGGDGAMMGTQVVVSAEWTEMLRRLMQAGILSAPVVSAAMGVRTGQVMLSQSDEELPKGVRDALGEGPEVRGMRQTGKAGAGMSEPPRHHVLPREHREWFEQRGFTDEMSIDHFCVRMERASHEAIHGGGDWQLGRTWPGEWNQMIMEALREAEVNTGRMLTRNEVLKIVATRMRLYKIPVNFSSWRGP